MIRQTKSIKFLYSILAGISLSLTLNSSIIGSKVSAQVPLSQSTNYLAQANITVEDLQGFNGVIKSLAVTPDGKLLLVGTGDGSLTAIDLETKKNLYSKAVLVNSYSSIAFNLEKDILVVGDDQNEVNLWYYILSGKAHKKLQGLASPTLDRRNKYRPRNCNGDATSKLEFKNIAKQINRI